MKLDIRAPFAALALTLAACQGGFDSGAGGMPGEVGPPVNGQGPLGAQQGMGTNGPNGPNGPNGNTGGPTAGPNGLASLANPGATLAPNQTQYPVADGPTGMKCASVQLFSCTFSFNVPSTASPAPGASPSPKPKATPTPTPTPSSDSDDDSGDDSPSPSPTPPGTVTMQMEPLPNDAPSMTNPDLRALKIVPLVAMRFQSDTDFVLNGTAIAQYALPKTQFAGRTFALQLYNESFVRIGKTSKRVDTFVGTYSQYTVPSDSTVNFTFNIPDLTAKRGQIWLLALYGLTYPPNTTPSPSPSASSSAAPSGSPSAAPSGSASPKPAST